MAEAVTFVDQTLEEALKNRRVGISGFLDIKEKILTMSQIIFDLTLPSLEAVSCHGPATAENIRACIQPCADQVARAHELGCYHVKVSLGHKAVRKIPVSVAEALKQAQTREKTVALHITRTCQYSKSDVLDLCRLVKEYGINSFVFDDRQGELDSLDTYRRLLDLQQKIPCSLEYYGNNDKGLATGNALAAIKSGVRRIAVAVGGIAGYPATEEVLMSARYLLKLPLHIPDNLAVCCEEILGSIGQRVKPTKPIIGSHIFAHESGIHVDGVHKKSDLYEPFAPETVGLSRKIIIGKHSGKAAIELKLKEMNLSLPPEFILKVLEKVRGLAIRQKAPVSNHQLQALVCEVTS